MAASSSVTSRDLALVLAAAGGGAAAAYVVSRLLLPPRGQDGEDGTECEPAYQADIDSRDALAFQEECAPGFDGEFEPEPEGWQPGSRVAPGKDFMHPRIVAAPPMAAPADAQAMACPPTLLRQGELPSLPFGAVVNFTNCFAELDLCYPWRVSNPSIATGTGFSLGGKRLVTNHHVVKDATCIRVQRHGVPGNYEARVLVASAVCDLALVTVDDEEFWVNMPECTLQEEVPGLDDTVVAVGYPMGAKTVTLTRGVVSNVHLKDLTLSEHSEMQLTIQIDAAINPGNSGGPVFNQLTNEVVGVAFAGLQEAEGHGYIIPAPVLRNFIRVFETTGDFKALPSLGLTVQSLSNPSMRKRAFGGEKPSHHEGVLVVDVEAFSCAKEAGVQAGDVLVSLDGQAVSEEAEVVFRGHERVHFSYMYTRKMIGDVVRLSLLRRKEGSGGLVGVELEVTLSAAKKLVPRELWRDYQPDYVVAGGLVLVVAGIPLAQQLGQKDCWGPRHMGVLAAEEDADNACDHLEAQAVMVCDCLAHELNVGYQSFIGLQVKEINGVCVRNLKHAASIISGADVTATPFTVIRFKNKKPFAVFETAALVASTPTILRQHKIPSWTSFELGLPPP